MKDDEEFRVLYLMLVFLFAVAAGLLLHKVGAEVLLHDCEAHGGEVAFVGAENSGQYICVQK